MQEERALMLWGAGKFTWPLTQEQLLANQREYEQNEHAWIFTALDEAGAMVGQIAMRLADYEKNSVHLGLILIDSSRRGEGLGRSMVEQAVRYAREILGMQRVTVHVFAENPAAKACYERVGFRVEQEQKEALCFGEEKWTLYRMALA
jgi:RimJ/RimL family protein N-acetyltransferase